MQGKYIANWQPCTIGIGHQCINYNYTLVKHIQKNDKSLKNETVSAFRERAFYMRGLLLCDCINNFVNTKFQSFFYGGSPYLLR